MDTASSTLPEILGRANEEELRGVLIALEGRVVDVGKQCDMFHRAARGADLHTRHQRRRGYNR